jgi:uncharacterized protein (TIGR00369 family)
VSDPIKPRGAHNELMGSRFVSFDRETETVTLTFEAPAAFVTPRGIVQGGLVAGFLDEVMGWAHVLATDYAEAPLNLDLNMTLLGGVPAGQPIIGTGRVLRRGKRVIFLEGELRDEAGKVLARATSTAIPTPRPGAE